MASAAQTAANQANAKLSTGPVTEQGKAVVAKNAIKTGLTGRTVLLPADDAELYAKLIDSFRARFDPLGDAETELVQSMADTTWRIGRIPTLEAGIYAIGRAKLADLHPKEEDSQQRAMMIETEIFLAYERQLRNLQVQESRLRRYLEKDMEALKQLQQTRKSETSRRLSAAANALAEAFTNNKLDSFNPADLGFVFSRAEITARFAEIHPQLYKQLYAGHTETTHRKKVA